MKFNVAAFVNTFYIIAILQSILCLWFLLAKFAMDLPSTIIMIVLTTLYAIYEGFTNKDRSKSLLTKTNKEL